MFSGIQSNSSVSGFRRGYFNGKVDRGCPQSIMSRTSSTAIYFFTSYLKLRFIFQVAKDVIKEFADDGVKYLELRSTPREEKNTGKELKSYSLL